MRMLRDQRFELTSDVLVQAAREVGLDPLLERREPQIFQPRALHPRERLAELRQRRTAPQRERAFDVAGRTQALEPLQVELVRGNLEHVTARSCEERAL